MGHPVVMGRKHLGVAPGPLSPASRPAQHRRDSQSGRGSSEGAERAGSLDDALRLVDDAERVFVIGGGELYAAALPLADELLLTEIDLEVEGDTWFPSWDRVDFDETSRERHLTEDGVPFSFVTYVRRRAQPGRETSG